MTHFFHFSEYLPDVIEAFQGDDYEYDEYTLEEMYFNQLEEERLAKKRRKKKQLFTEEDAQTISMFKLHFNSAKNNIFEIRIRSFLLN